MIMMIGIIVYVFGKRIILKLSYLPEVNHSVLSNYDICFIFLPDSGNLRIRQVAGRIRLPEIAGSRFRPGPQVAVTKGQPAAPRTTPL